MEAANSSNIPVKYGNPRSNDSLGSKNKFCFGDPVWVFTKIKTWWPGQILDPSSLSSIAPKHPKNASILVDYIGNNSMVWCSPENVRPFMEDFEHRSTEKKSRLFLSVVQKTVYLYQNRLKAQEGLNESSGAVLVLSFAEGFPVPSNDALIATFCGFGPLNESKTKALSDNRSAQLVSIKESDAVESFKGIDKSNPYGPILMKCLLQHLLPDPKPMELKPCESKVANEPKDSPDLAHIKKNLDMMLLKLEKEGYKISAETRGTLEYKIKGLLKNVNIMFGSTSST